MTKTIYEQHTDAFANVSAYVILSPDNRYIGKVAIKFPKDGAGRLWSYTHIFGTEQTRGYAGGYGYDKRSAAVEEAARKINPVTYGGERCTDAIAFQLALSDIGGKDWNDALRDAGFKVLNAV